MRFNNLKHLMVLMIVLAFGLPTTAEAGIGKLWPFASKKHIKKQIDPLSGRVSELEEVNRQQAAQIKDIDERTQAGLKQAMTQVESADAKAIAAGETANVANASANRAFQSVGDVERRVSGRLENVENYRDVRTVQVNFKQNQTTVDETGASSLDELAAELKGAKGFVLEIQGFADATGTPQSNLEVSQKRAASVVRYLCEKHEIPLFRMRTLGMGSTDLVRDDNGRIDRAKSRRVEIHLLRNDSAELASR